MPRGKWIDKKTATHFNLVYRPQNDPLIHDESAPAMVLNPTQRPNASSSKTKALSDLASELGSDAQNIRDNEGEAANHGVFYDDTEYDYMQHLRDIGSGGGEAVFVEAKAPVGASKNKSKQPSLDDALRKLDLQNYSAELLDEEILPSKNLQRLTYQAQQDVPDAIAGFQPDMDPRLREVLEALEDEAYVDEDDDIFQELAKDAQELNVRQFEEEYPDYDDEDDEGWESDHTAKPSKECKNGGEEVPDLVNELSNHEGPPEAWLDDFKKFQRDQKTEKKPRVPGAGVAQSEIQSSIWTTTTNGGRRKKRNGAMTNPSNYSMTSSSLVRTEQLGILDGRFEKISEEYQPDFDGDMESVSGVSTASSVQGAVRQDLDGMLDEFLGGYSLHGKKRVKKGKWKNGLEQLDDVRRELGPARIRPEFL